MTGSIALEAVNLTKDFLVAAESAHGKRQRLRALDDVSIRLHQAEITALIGESGSGKSTLARILAQLDRQNAGQILLHGKPVKVQSKRQFRQHVQQVQLIFQDPFASLNPMRNVYDHVWRPMHLSGAATRRANASDDVLATLKEVHLTPARQMADKFPHELSGGQRQRVSIARALAATPSVILADEPISMLDVSMRLGILNLLGTIVAERSVALLYITHDIASARYFASRGLVMYAGRIVEEGTCEEITQSPAHPYTRLLVASAPDILRRQGGVLGAADLGEPPSLIDLPSGCSFSPRCPYAMRKCRSDMPPLIDIGGGRRSRCWLHDPATVQAEAPSPGAVAAVTTMAPHAANRQVGKPGGPAGTTN